MAKRLTTKQTVKLWDVLRELREQLERDVLIDDQLQVLVAHEVGFDPPPSSILTAIRELGIKLRKKPVQKTEVRMLAEIMGLALRKLTEDQDVLVVAAKLVDSDIRGAYGDRGPMVF
jgi:hypothetical protein